MRLLQIWIVVGQFSFLEAQDYCDTGSPTSDLDTTLGPVWITGADGSGFEADKYCGEGLRDLTKTHIVKLIIGNTYTITWGGDSCGNQFFKMGRMWIDWTLSGWNQIGDYDSDAITPIIESQSSFQEETTFTVPQNAVEGITRMRGLVVEDNNPASVHPCHHFAFGGLTDFGVELIANNATCMDTGPIYARDTTLGSVSIEGEHDSGFKSDLYCETGLRDLTKTHIVKLAIGRTYSITWGGDSCGSQLYKEGRMWIDWTHSTWQDGGDYDCDAITPIIGAENEWVKVTEFTVPRNAMIGVTRMRGMMIENSDPLALRPCLKFAFGGTTDFGVEIIG